MTPNAFPEAKAPDTLSDFQEEKLPRSEERKEEDSSSNNGSRNGASGDPFDAADEDIAEMEGPGRMLLQDDLRDEKGQKGSEDDPKANCPAAPLECKTDYVLWTVESLGQNEAAEEPIEIVATNETEQPELDEQLSLSSSVGIVTSTDIEPVVDGEIDQHELEENLSPSSSEVLAEFTAPVFISDMEEPESDEDLSPSPSKDLLAEFPEPVFSSETEGSESEDQLSPSPSEILVAEFTELDFNSVMEVPKSEEQLSPSSSEVLAESTEQVFNSEMEETKSEEQLSPSSSEVLAESIEQVFNSEMHEPKSVEDLSPASPATSEVLDVDEYSEPVFSSETEQPEVHLSPSSVVLGKLNEPVFDNVVCDTVKHADEAHNALFFDKFTEPVLKDVKIKTPATSYVGQKHSATGDKFLDPVFKGKVKTPARTHVGQRHFATIDKFHQPLLSGSIKTVAVMNRNEWGSVAPTGKHFQWVQVGGTWKKQYTTDEKSC
jgi:hypothetical protein